MEGLLSPDMLKGAQVSGLLTPPDPPNGMSREGPEHLVFRGTKAPDTHRHLLPHLQEG